MIVLPPFMDSPEYPAVRAWMHADPYDRDTNVAGHIRHRLEVNTPHDAETRQWLLGIMWPCAACGEVIHRIRARKGGGWSIYFAACCPSEVKPGCNKGSAAPEEYRWIIEDLLGVKTPSEPSGGTPQGGLPFAEAM